VNSLDCEGRSDQFTDAQEQEIVRIAETQGWPTAAHDYMRSRNHIAYRLAVDEYIAQLRFLLPLAATSSVLQFRSGWGALAVNLAQCTALAVAMDDRLNQLRFSAARRKEAGLTRLHTVCGWPAPRLPFVDGAFDAVIFSEAPTPCRGGSTGGHVFTLREARRVLRPNGWILLALTNRPGWARWAQSTSTPVHSYWGSRAGLLEAGFRDVRFYAPLPSEREPFIIAPLEQRRLVEYCLDGLFATRAYRAKLEARRLGAVFELARSLWRVSRRLRLTRLARFIAPSYYVVARA
jgi:SAM-dependent methyltransferase